MGVEFLNLYHYISFFRPEDAELDLSSDEKRQARLSSFAGCGLMPLNKRCCKSQLLQHKSAQHTCM